MCVTLYVYVSYVSSVSCVCVALYDMCYSYMCDTLGYMCCCMLCVVYELYVCDTVGYVCDPYVWHSKVCVICFICFICFICESLCVTLYACHTWVICVWHSRICVWLMCVAPYDICPMRHMCHICVHESICVTLYHMCHVCITHERDMRVTHVCHTHTIEWP